MRRVALLAAVALLAGCGGSDEPRLTVFAASSLTEVFPRIDSHPRYSFAGSDDLATQIRQGAKADVYAAASPNYPEELFRTGVVERPAEFIANSLVLVVPRAGRRRIHGVLDLARPGTKVVVGAAGVPIGDYTRKELERLHATAVLKRVVSEEPDVKGIVAKVALGDADAGFVYATDARAAGEKVRAIGLAPNVPVVYEVAVVRSSEHRREARAFVARLLSTRAQEIFTNAGFESFLAHRAR